MAISYNKLWKLLVDKKMSKADLRRAAGLAPNTMTKLRRDEQVAMNVLERICYALDADFGDMQNVLSTIEEAYYELRQNLSRRVYNTPYDKLGPEYRQMVNNAIPTRVYMAEC